MESIRFKKIISGKVAGINDNLHQKYLFYIFHKSYLVKNHIPEFTKVRFLDVHNQGFPD